METVAEHVARVINERNHLADRLSETQSLLTEIADQADTDRARVLELEALVARQSTLINRLREERDHVQQGYNNLELENPLLRGQVERQRETIEQLTDENQRLRIVNMDQRAVLVSLRQELKDAEANNTKLRDAIVQAPFAPKSREVLPEFDGPHD